LQEKWRGGIKKPGLSRVWVKGYMVVEAGLIMTGQLQTCLSHCLFPEKLEIIEIFPKKHSEIGFFPDYERDYKS